MESHLYTQWVQSQIPEGAQQQQQHHGVVAQHEAAGNDWAKDRSQAVPSPTLTSDLNDFATLGDLSGQPSAQAFFNPYLPTGYLPLSPFNAIPYGAAWSSTPSHIPVSTYSSLNGATTAAPTTSQPQPTQQHSTPPDHQPQPQQPSTHQIMIDPLLTLNGNTHNLQNSYPQSPTYSTMQIQLQQPQQPQQSQQSQPPMPQRSYSYNQPLLYTSPYYRLQTQQTSQGTLSPQALHSPTMPMMQTTFYAHPQSLPQIQPQAISPASAQSAGSALTSGQGEASSSANPTSASKSASASGPSPEEKADRKRKFVASIQPLLLSSAFSGAQSVQLLTDRIADFGIAEVDAPTRLDILARVRDGAGNHYYRAWSENGLAVDIIRDWTKAAAKDESGVLQETVMPLLHLIDRLPLTVEILTSSKLGKIVRTFTKPERPPAIRDMASNLERRWREMLLNKEGDGKEDSKKRKVPDSGVTTKAAVPIKKAALGTATSTKPLVVKREARAAAPLAPIKDAKADSSFFSAPKPKAKLPSFKKAPVPVPMKKEESNSSSASNISQPSNFNPFEDVLKSMKAGKRDSPAVSTPPPSTTSDGQMAQPSSMAKALRKKKSVTWAPESRLESIKLIERAVYDDDPTDGLHTIHTSRDLDREEGAALHAIQLLEETIDWYEPAFVEMPPDPDPNNPRLPRGHGSQERSTQEERELVALSAVYMTPSQIPESPAEPAIVLSDEEVDKDLKEMELGDDMHSILYDPIPQGVPMTIDPNANVTQLIGQLNSGIPGPIDAAALPTQQTTGLDLSAVANLQPEQVQRILAQLSTMGATGQQPYGQHGDLSAGGVGGNDASGWGSTTTPHQFSDYDHGYQDDSDKPHSSRWEERSNGRGGRGRGGRGSRGGGRGEDWGGKPYSSRKSRPCLFFQQQRCKYGDQCDFLHELVPPGER